MINLGMFNVYIMVNILTCDLHALHPADGGQFSARVVKEKQTLILTQLTVHLKTDALKDLIRIEL